MTQRPVHKWKDPILSIFIKIDETGLFEQDIKIFFKHKISKNVINNIPRAWNEMPLVRIKKAEFIPTFPLNK